MDKVQTFSYENIIKDGGEMVINSYGLGMENGYRIDTFPKYGA